MKKKKKEKNNYKKQKLYKRKFIIKEKVFWKYGSLKI